MLAEKEQLKKLKDFGIWLDKNGVVCLAKGIYTEGGKNIQLNRLRMDKDREIKRLSKELKKLKGTKAKNKTIKPCEDCGRYCENVGGKEECKDWEEGYL